MTTNYNSNGIEQERYKSDTNFVCMFIQFFNALLLPILTIRMSVLSLGRNVLVFQSLEVGIVYHSVLMQRPSFLYLTNFKHFKNHFFFVFFKEIHMINL